MNKKEAAAFLNVSEKTIERLREKVSYQPDWKKEKPEMW
jgi:DNA-binding XRE family transcriptional regulator